MTTVGRFQPKIGLLLGRIRIFFSIESNNSEISIDVIKALVHRLEKRICTAVHSAPVAYLFPPFIPTSEHPVLFPTRTARPCKDNFLFAVSIQVDSRKA